MGRTRRLASLAAVVTAGIAVGRAFAARRVDDAPVRPLFARGRVGADWASRNDLAGDPVPGEVGDFAVYDRDDFDARAVHPEVRRFYERTVDYDLVYETTWHRGFRAGAWLASFATSRIEQLNLPGQSDARARRLESRIVRVAPSAGVTGDPRVWTRTDPDTGRAVFVAVYATHERDGTVYATAATPLPWAALSTVLRPEPIRGDADGDGVAFTTRGDDGGDGDGDGDGDRDGDGDGKDDDGDGDEGLYLVTPLGAFALPIDQRFRVRPAGASDASRTPTDAVDLVATHEMWLLGRQFLTIRYRIGRSGS